MSNRLKTVPKFHTEAEERRFWETHDSTDFIDWGKAERARLPNLKPSTTSISLRLPVALLEKIKVAANRRDIPYQSLIKSWLADRAGQAEASKVYKLFAKAMRERKQITCTYRGHHREVCPIILGHRDGQERALTYQFGGRSSRRLPSHGAWRCFSLSEITNVELRDGPWFSGDAHTRPQGCVVDVDLDVNLDSPYNPRRTLPRRSKLTSHR
jgi:predicted DNA binding CopG/RHH family protein